MGRRVDDALMRGAPEILLGTRASCSGSGISRTVTPTVTSTAFAEGRERDWDPDLNRKAFAE
jgi:hypothetical protein